MTPTPHQAGGMNAVARWMKDPGQQVFCFFGYAGTGKTTLAVHLTSGQNKRWIYAAYTGRAASVMRKRGCVGARTTHSMIYRPNGETLAVEIRAMETRIARMDARLQILAESEHPSAEEMSEALTANKRLAELRVQLKLLNEDTRHRFQLWEGSELADPDVAGVVLDEASMIDADMARDLESFGKKILVLGDPGQLPPVGAGGHYTERTPDYLLTEVHRQARDSGILALATHCREGGRIQDFDWAAYNDVEIIRISDTSLDDRVRMMHGHDQTIVGRNRTRVSAIMSHRGGSRFAGTEPPQPGELLVCLRNDYTWGLLNGTQWVVEDVSCRDPDLLTCVMKLREVDGASVVECEAWQHHLLGREEELDGGDRRERAELTFGSVLTVHKAQGGGWPRVLVVDESSAFRESAPRWRYTAVTRASERLTVLV